MSKYYSMLFIWTKGAKIRREIVKIIFSNHEKKDSIFLSKITDSLNKRRKEKQFTVSIVRFHLKSLIKYGLVQPMNKGGRPEYLFLTKEGFEAYEQISLENGKKT